MDLDDTTSHYYTPYRLAVITQPASGLPSTAGSVVVPFCDRSAVVVLSVQTVTICIALQHVLLEDVSMFDTGMYANVYNNF